MEKKAQQGRQLQQQQADSNSWLRPEYDHDGRDDVVAKCHARVFKRREQSKSSKRKLHLNAARKKKKNKEDLMQSTSHDEWGLCRQQMCAKRKALIFAMCQASTKGWVPGSDNSNNEAINTKEDTKRFEATVVVARTTALDCH